MYEVNQVFIRCERGVLILDACCRSIKYSSYNLRLFIGDCRVKYWRWSVCNLAWWFSASGRLCLWLLMWNELSATKLTILQGSCWPLDDKMVIPELQIDEECSYGFGVAGWFIRFPLWNKNDLMCCLVLWLSCVINPAHPSPVNPWAT